MDTLELKSIEELKDMVFYIPAYQRGYRWTEPQVKDLLDDILEFSQKKDAGIYCLQPLVVKESPKGQILDKIRNASDLDEVKRILKGKWEVVDGQQRLTTIRLILEVLQKPRFYDIEYETRKGSARFLNEIAGQTDQNAETNIDYHHIKEAVSVIREWWEKKGKETENFLKVLLERVKFIWYEIGRKEDPKEKEEEDPKEKKEKEEEDPKEVFTRLNIGKISLTNAELIKALLLNKSNFGSNDDKKIRLWQQEIAMEWDVMEYALQSTEFWLFLNEPGNERPTRIDFIFDMIYRSNLLQCKNEEETKATDNFSTFRYFYHYVSKQKKEGLEQATRTIWEKVREIFQTLQEWFDDKELYHYIGFLICMGRRVDDIYTRWTQYKAKSDFRKFLMAEEIKKNYIRCKDIENTVYETDSELPNEIKGGSKRECLPILLLHNIQTVINQNKIRTGNGKYDDGVFYKFPFHLYKSEGWDVEHIDSNTENKLNNIQSQREWLLNAYFGLQDETYKPIRDQIEIFFNTEKGDVQDEQLERDKKFDELRNQIEKINGNDRLSQTEKNKIWNFTLLDSSTNRSYGNAIFPTKRRVIIGKDQGKKFAPPTTKTDENGKIQIEDNPGENGQSSFIPPCTKYVFLKYYNKASFDPNTWNKKDAEAYKNNIKEVLNIFCHE